MNRRVPKQKLKDKLAWNLTWKLARSLLFAPARVPLDRKAKMKLRFFWYNGSDYTRYRWALRGFAFDYPGYSANVHWIALLFLYGSNWQSKIINARRAWWTVLTLGKKS